MLFMADLLPNGLHEKVMICSICYITKSRLDVQLENPLGKVQQVQHGFYIRPSIHLLLK